MPAAEPGLGRTRRCHVSELKPIRQFIYFIFFFNLSTEALSNSQAAPRPSSGGRAAERARSSIPVRSGRLPRCSRRVPRCCPCLQALPSRLFPSHPRMKKNIYMAPVLILRQQAPALTRCISFSGDIPDPPGQGPVQPALGDPASAGGLD